MSRAKNQTTEILNYLQNEGTLTSKDAFDLFGATRLSARIFDLRKKGYDIETRMVAGYTRYGDTCEYAVYVYHGKVEEDE